MEIQPNQRISGLDPVAVTRTTPRQRQPATEAASFEATAAMDRALNLAPDTRAEVVERAKQLIKDPEFPPQETIKRLAELLASRLSARID